MKRMTRMKLARMQSDMSWRRGESSESKEKMKT